MLAAMQASSNANLELERQAVDQIRERLIDNVRRTPGRSSESDGPIVVVRTAGFFSSRAAQREREGEAWERGIPVLDRAAGNRLQICKLSTCRVLSRDNVGRIAFIVAKGRGIPGCDDPKGQIGIPQASGCPRRTTPGEGCARDAAARGAAGDLCSALVVRIGGEKCQRRDDNGQCDRKGVKCVRAIMSVLFLLNSRVLPVRPVVAPAARATRNGANAFG